VVGRFPLRGIPAGEPLRVSETSRIRAQASELRGRHILTLPVNRRTLPLAVAGTRATLVLAPRGADAPAAIVNDAIVLNAGETDDSASVVVAVRETDLAALARSLGASEVFVVQPVTGPAAP
jgi:hypothetical protein